MFARNTTPDGANVRPGPDDDYLLTVELDMKVHNRITKERGADRSRRKLVVRRTLIVYEQPGELWGWKELDCLIKLPAWTNVQRQTGDLICD